MIPITPFLFTHSDYLISPPSPSFHFSFTIFTVSLSDSVVETCHSGLPKGRTLVLPFALCQKNNEKKKTNLTETETLQTRGAAGTELTHRLAEKKKNSLWVHLHTQSDYCDQILRFTK